MKITKATKTAIQNAAHTVEKGGVIVYPTDTVYGLGCNPLNEEAVKRIFKIKGERTKPLPILASDGEKVEETAQITEKTLKLAEKFWPGPLTIVLHKKPQLPNIVTLGLDSVAIRIPDHKTALALIRISGGLLIGTSANKSGKKSPRTALEAAEQIGEEVDVILDGGPTPIGASSTVIDLTGKQPKILREGPITMADVLEVWFAKVS